MEMKQQLQSMRTCIRKRVPNFDKKLMVSIEFSRMSDKYEINNSPIKMGDRIGRQLESSFNEFMDNLKVNYSNHKLEGSMLFGTTRDNFMIGYKDYVKQGKKLVPKNYSIDGMI